MRTTLSKGRRLRAVLPSPTSGERKRSRLRALLKRRLYVYGLCAFAVACGLVLVQLQLGSLRAANGVDTWTGASTAWLTGGNWSGTNTPPISGDSLVFGAAGAGGLDLNNNLTSVSFDVAGIIFNSGAGAFIIGNGTTTANAGNVFILTGAVTNNSASLETINNPFSVTAVQTFTTTAGGGNITLGGNISGAGGGITVTGGGTVTLTGTNAFTGGTTISSGTLQLGNGGTTGSLAASSAITNNGALAFDRSNTVTQGTDFASAIGGSGQVIQQGGGSLILNGSNSYTGGTTVSSGTLVLNSNTAAGGYNAGAITLGNASTGNSNVELDFGSGLTGTDLTLRDAQGVRRVNPITVANTGGTGTATLGFTGATSTIYADLTLNGPLAFTSNSTTRLQRSYEGLISGPGAGAGNNSVIFNLGSGNWLDIYPKDTGTVSVANTFTGNLLVESGNLEVNGLAFIANIAANQNLTFPSTASVTVASGATLQFVWGSETFDGLNGAGTIQRNTADGLGNATLTIGANGGSGSFSGAINSLFNLTKTGSGTQILSGANTYTGATTISAGTLQLGAGGTTGTLSTGSSLTDNATLVFDRTNAVTQGTDFAAVIGGSGQVIQRGAGGTLTLNGANTYAGGTVVSQGTLVLNSNTAAGGYSAGALSLGDASTGNNNVELDFASGITGTDLTLRDAQSVRRVNPITVANTGGTGTATLGFTGATSTIYSDITLNGPVVITSNSTTPLQRSYEGLISGPGAGAANNSVIFNLGSGNWLDIYPKDTGTVSVANTFTGNLLVESGNLEVNGLAFIANSAANQNISIPSTASVTVASGATLQFVWGSETFDGLNGAGTVQRNTADDLGNATLTIGANGGSGSFSGTINSLFNLTKTGSGTQILSGANTYTGATTISAGTLQLGAGGTTGTLSTSSAMTDNATLAFDRSNAVTQGADFASVISGSGQVVQLGSGSLILNGVNTYTGATVVSAGMLSLTGSLTGGTAISTSGLGILSESSTGVISGAASLVQDGTGTSTLSGANTYSGGTTVSTGTLQVGVSSATGGSGATVSITNGATGTGPLTVNGGTVDLRAFNLAVGGLSGSGGIIASSSTTSAGSLTIVTSGAETYSGTIADSTGSGNQTLSVTISGNGTQILSGANIFTGGSVVAGGTLQLGDGYHSTSLGGASGTPGASGYFPSGGAAGGAGAAAVVVNNNGALSVAAGASILGGSGGGGGAGLALMNGFSTIGGDGGDGALGGAAVTLNNSGALNVESQATIVGGGGGSGGVGGAGIAGSGDGLSGPQPSGPGGIGGNGSAGATAVAVNSTGALNVGMNARISGGAGGIGGGGGAAEGANGGGGGNGGAGGAAITVTATGALALSANGVVTGGAGGAGAAGGDDISDGPAFDEGYGGAGGDGGAGGAGVTLAAGASLTNRGTINGGAGSGGAAGGTGLAGGGAGGAAAVVARAFSSALADH